MKSNLLIGVVASALFTFQAGLAWSATDSKPAPKTHAKNSSKTAASKKVARPKVKDGTTSAVITVKEGAGAVAPAINPYLQASPPANSQPSNNPYLDNSPSKNGNPYLSNAQPTQQANPFNAVSDSFSQVGSVLPSFGNSEESLLPSIKKVYPTGEKPLVVVTFKCPIEMAGIKGGPTKVLHDVVNLGMDAVNSTNLLSFNLQQVCQ